MFYFSNNTTSETCLKNVYAISKESVNELHDNEVRVLNMLRINEIALMR